MSRFRAFTFTINNDTYNDLQMLIDSNFRYLCFGFEHLDKGTRHIQGYIYYYDARTVDSVSKDLPRAHIEVSKGTAAQNALYTSKEGDNNWYSFGEKPQQGQAKWDQIEDVMADPRSNPQVYNQYRKMYNELKKQKDRIRKRELRIIMRSRLYSIAKEYESVHIEFETDDMSLYDSEDVVFIPAHTHCIAIDMWLNNIPPKIRRGYEIIKFDPEIIYLYCDSIAEKVRAIIKYNQYIDGVDEKD